LKYHEQLLHQPGAKAPDMSRDDAPPAHGADAVWREDFAGALKQAQADKKNVLLDFTGSDWCPWCIKFDQDVLSTSKFGGYAAQKLELVKVDFPRHSPLPDAQRQANDALAKQFGVDGFPTYVLLSPAGKELGRQVGYLNGGPDAFVAELEKFSGR
jgi:protein disulfide-isomerase